MDHDVFELRWSIRVLDEPSTRRYCTARISAFRYSMFSRLVGALAFRVHDSTIKAVDSHLRINGVVGDLSCRDIPLQIRHAAPAHLTRQANGAHIHNSGSDDDGVYTSDLEELLSLITGKGASI